MEVPAALRGGQLLDGAACTLDPFAGLRALAAPARLTPRRIRIWLVTSQRCGTPISLPLRERLNPEEGHQDDDAEIPVGD
jgi:hypothetical protein